MLRAGKRGKICVDNNVSTTMCPQQCVLVCQGLKVASHPKCDILGKKIFYDGKIDLTPIFVLKKKFRKNIVSTGSYGQNSVFFT